MRNGNRFGVSADVFLHLPGLPWMRSLAVLLQDKLQGWPHVGPLQSGLAWTIARLCWPISHFFLARLTTAWVTSSPACLRVYRAPALNCLWYHRAPSINGCTVCKMTSRTRWKKPSGILTRDPSRFFPLSVFLGIFPSALPSGPWIRYPQRKLWHLPAMTPDFKWGDDEAVFPM